MNVEIFQSGHLFITEDHVDGALPLVGNVTEGEAIRIVTLVGRKLWRAEDQPGERPFVWSVRLPSSSSNNYTDESYNEFASAVGTVGEGALHEARTFLRGHFDCGDLSDEHAYLATLVDTLYMNYMNNILAPVRSDPNGELQWDALR